MDAATAQMMADLGLARRDLVSAPEDDRSARFNPRAEQAVEAEVKQFRSRQKAAASGAGGSKDDATVKVMAWNLATSFDQDEVANQMPDRYSGQGHRAELRRRIGGSSHQDDHLDNVRARYGEERTAWLNERNQVPQVTEFRSMLATGHGRSRSDQSGNQSNSTRRRQAPAPRGTNRNRAPSPRAAGTIRFGPNNTRSMMTPGGERVISMPSKPPASMLTSIHAPAGCQTVKAPVISKITEGSSKGGVPQTKANGPPASYSSGGQPARPAANDRSSSVSPAQHQIYHNQALVYAANPGEKCDNYHKQFPERLKYLGPAKSQLIKEAIRLVFNDDDKAIEEYIGHHRDRAWMVEAVLKAKHQIEEETKQEIEAYCAKNPYHMVFLNAAKHVFEPKPTKALLSETKDEVTVNVAAKAGAHQVTPEEIPRKSSPASSASSVTSETSAATTISAPESLLSAAGSLAVAFYDVAGQLLGNRQVPLKVPAFATLSVLSKARRFNPRDLIEPIEALAQNMKEASITQVVHGAKLADDGLWEEVDEEL